MVNDKLVNVVVYGLNSIYMGEIYFNKDKAALAHRLFNEGGYNTLWQFVTDARVPEKICEEVFDLTNNPSRQDEREEGYGTGKSLSVGDIVEINDVAYLCDSMGWVKL